MDKREVVKWIGKKVIVLILVLMMALLCSLDDIDFGYFQRTDYTNLTNGKARWPDISIKTPRCNEPVVWGTPMKRSLKRLTDVRGK